MIFQIPKFLRVPESRVVGEHFGLLFGSGTRDPGELRVTKVYISGFPLLFPFMKFSLGFPPSGPNIAEREVEREEARANRRA